MLRLGGKTVALATDCALEESLETFDGRTKDDEGAVDIPGAITGTLSTEALLGMNKGKLQQTYATLRAAFIARQPIDVEVFLAANAVEAIPGKDWSNGPMTSRGFAPVAGKALIKSLRLGGGVAGKATMSIQMGVQGELSPVAQPNLSATVEDGVLSLSGNIELSRGVLDIADYEATVEDNVLNLADPVEVVNEL